MGATYNAYAITGIQDLLDANQHDPLRKVPVRMEIDDWFLSEEPVHVNQRALFFPAFLELAKKDPKDLLSWYQIAGIHGVPFVPWDEPGLGPATPNQGYCTHNSVLFLTWHRPYMLLWEQVIYKLMLIEADKFPLAEQPALKEAAASWRLPYWDWALKKSRDVNNPENLDYQIPLVLESETVEIRLPTGKFGPFKNAFHHFEMPGGITFGDKGLEIEDKETGSKTDISVGAIPLPKYDIPFNLCKSTSRHPQTNTVDAAWENGHQNNEPIVVNLRDRPATEGARPGNLTGSLRDSVYRILTITYFEDFGTKRIEKAAHDSPRAYDSSESIHDSIHSWCGGLIKDDWLIPNQGKRDTILVGHMGLPPVSSFDPLFWIHHCNIDRLFAIWQVLHDDSWFDSSDERRIDEGTYAIPQNNADTAETPLRPFHKSHKHDDYYTSVDIKEVTPLGYTYPGLEKWKYTKDDGTYNKEDHLAALAVLLNKSYNSARQAAQKSKLTADPGQPGASNGSVEAIRKETGQGLRDLIGIDDYVVDVVYEKFDLGGVPFTAHIFVGAVPEHPPYTFENTDSLVGEVFNFSVPTTSTETTSGCGNCKVQQNDFTKSSGRVILTNALITRWKNQLEHTPRAIDDDPTKVLKSMEPEDVIDFLKYNLHWRVTSMGQAVDIARIPSLKVTFAVGKADHYKDDTKMSRFYDYRAAYEVTDGRAGGARPGNVLYPPGYEYGNQQ